METNDTPEVIVGHDRQQDDTDTVIMMVSSKVAFLILLQVIADSDTEFDIHSHTEKQFVI